MKRNFILLSLFTAFFGVFFYIFQYAQFLNNDEHKADGKDKYSDEGKRREDPRIASEINRLIRLKPDQEKPDYPAGHQMLEFMKYYRQTPSNARTEETLQWIERGPGNFAGRARAILVDVADRSNRTWLIGSASGGIWKTTNEGNTWKNVTPNLPNLATVCLAQCIDNPRIMYAGTGEGAFSGGSSGINGAGILKSTDGGETWQLLGSTLISESNNFQNVSSIIVDPKNENIVLAATSNGYISAEFASAIMRSEDGGRTWTKVYGGFSWMQQIEFDPTNFNKQYASVQYRGMVKSIDGGKTWQETSLFTVAGGFNIERTEFAISPVNPKKIFASIGYEDRSGSGLFFSDDEGETWRVVEDRVGGGSKDYLLQGEYNNAIVAHPYDENAVFWGGVEIWRADMRQGATRNEANRFTAITGTNIGFLQLTRVQNWQFADGTLDIRDSLNVSTVEIRFGAGRKQKAHRFLTSPVGAGAGVPANRYTYQDYVDVPFEAWDTDKNRQLMVSFRDQENNGVFNLNVREPNDMELLTNREYIYIHNVPYEADRPNNNIARDGGQEFEYMYNLWPYLSTGSTWNADMLPNAILKINAPAITFQSSNIQEIATNRENNQLRLNGKIHVDQHDFVTVRLDPNRRTFRWIVANDGGIYISDDEGGSFVPKNTGMNTNQFYHATKKTKATEYLGGVQDGATLQSQVGFNADANMPYNERFATRIGDSFESVWHAQRDNLLLSSAQRNVIIKSSDGGAIWRNSINGMTDTGFNNTRAPFFTKLANSHRAPDLVFAVSQTGVWRSTDFGDNWTSIPITGTQWGGFLDVEVSDANPNIVWAGGGMSDQRSMYVSQNGGLTFTPVSKFAKALGNITTIVPDPNDENTVYLTFSQYRSPKILRSTDLGRTWEDISGFGAMGTRSMNGFPDVATYCVFVFPDKQKIWAGTEIGLFESLDNGRTWKYANNGLPAVHVWDLKERDGQVIAATHGRGIWTVDMNIRYPNQEAPVTVGLFSNLPEAKPAKVYPNPSQGNIVLELPPSSLNRFEVQVFNALGQEVFREKNINTGKTSLDLSTLQRGNYVLKAYNGKELFTSKIIITD